jgi:nucleoside-diphosphate-sugar epimerase
MVDKPRVLVLGGCGFIGRHLVTYLFQHKLASRVCVADKQLYQIAGLSEQEKAIFENKDFITFKQADLASEVHIPKVFEHDGGNWTIVINCAAVTKYSQGKEVYDHNVVRLSKLCSAAAAQHKCRRYIEVSTGQVYEGGKKPSTEHDKLKPWTEIAKASLEAEGCVAATHGLNYVIIRPAIVYGTGDVYGLTPRLIVGSVYKESKETLKSLYTKDLKLNTVHVKDVAKAIWFLTDHGDSGSIWNLADKGDTDQGKINQILEELFGIKTKFINSMEMTAGKALGTKFLVGIANDLHLKPFSDACKKYNIQETPLTPYLDEELVKENSTSIDGSAIEKLGFQYDYPNGPTAPLLKEVLEDYVSKGYFPKELIPQ